MDFSILNGLFDPEQWSQDRAFLREVKRAPQAPRIVKRSGRGAVNTMYDTLCDGCKDHVVTLAKGIDRAQTREVLRLLLLGVGVGIVFLLGLGFR